MSKEPRDTVMVDHGVHRVKPGHSYACWVTAINAVPEVPDYYAAIGLGNPTITSPGDIVAAYKAIPQKDINRAFKKASVKSHPDKNVGNEEEATAKFLFLEEARHNLSDPGSKQKYDADLEAYLTTPSTQVLVDYQIAAKDKRMQPTVSFIVHPHVSYLEIDIPYWQDNLAGQSQKHVGVLRLNCKAITTMKLDEIPPDHVADILPGVEEDIQEGDVFYLFAARQIKFEAVSAESLFINTDTHGVLDYFRSAFYGMQNINLIINGSFKTKEEFDFLQCAFDTERPKSLFYKWYTNIPNRYRTQFGQILEPDERPKYDLNPRLSKFNWVDLVTTYGFSAAAELEYQVKLAEEINEASFSVRLIGLPFAEHEGLGTRYLALISLSSQNNFRIVPGDKLKINFNTEVYDKEKSWHGLVVDPLPLTPIDTVIAIITRPWSKENGEGSWSDATDMTDAIPWRKLGSRKTARELIATARPIPVKIWAEYSDEVMRRNIKNLGQLSDLTTRPEIKQLLLGNNYIDLPEVDMYELVREEFPDPVAVMDELNADQRAAVDLAGRAPAGQLVIVAPGGCGKTFLAKQLIRPLIMSTKKTIRILSTSTVNDSLNDLALAHQKDCELVMSANPKLKPLMVTRFHGIDTEIKVSRVDAEKNRERGEQDCPKLHKDTSREDLAILQTLAYASEVFDYYHRQSKQTLPGINDSRLKLVEMSLGHRMLQVAGVIPSAFNESTKFTDFAESFRQYRRGSIFDKQRYSTFEAETKNLLQYTISRTNILVCTLFHAGDTVVTENFDAAITLTDEGARGNLLEYMVLWANFPNCKSNIFLGDPRQMKPIMQTEKFASGGTNGFVGQMRTSPIAIWCANGLQVIFLRTQYRGVPIIMEIPSQVFYQGMLLHGPSTHEISRPICLRMKEYNRETFLKNSSVVFVDVKHGEQKKSGTSSYNEENIKWTLNTLADILEKRICRPEDVSIITPYGAQHRLYRSGLEVMDDLLPGIDVRKVQLANIGAYQGRQNRVVFVDFVVKEKPGFLKDADLLCVALTRAQDAEYILGNRSAWDNFKGTNGRVLKRVMSAIISYKYTVQEREITSPYYHEGQVDHSFGRWR
jgi:AAA domain/DnaJ domain